MLTVATTFYDPTWGQNVPEWSRCYTPEWVDRLYRGIARHYSQPFRFVALTDRPYRFHEPIEIQPLRPDRWDRVPMQLLGIQADRLMLTGLDTLITGPLDDILAYDGPLAVPRDPYRTGHACNAVVLCPPRPDLVAIEGVTDMTIMDMVPHDWLDDLFPGRIVSYKARVLEAGLDGASIVYFHGVPKQHALVAEPWVQAAWV